MVTPRLVDHRKALVILVMVISIGMIPLVLGIQLDRTLKSAYVTSSPAYTQYREFLEVFGDDEFILVAIKNDKGASDPEVLKALAAMTGKLEKFPEITRVISLSNLKFFQERKGVFGNYHVLEDKEGIAKLPEASSFEKIRTALPLTDFLISPDLKTLGIIIRLNDEWRFHPELASVQKRIATVVAENLPPGSDYRMTGASVIREEVQSITMRTAIIYGILCTMVIALVTFYIFKSLRVALTTLAVIGISVEWMLGLMSALGIPLNSTTSLTFGLVVVISVSTVIHIVTHYYESSREVSDRIEAVKTALRVIARPSLMCALTTSVAFSTIMVSTIPMVQQLGFVMAAGVLISYVLAMVLTPAFLIVLKPVDQRTQERMSGDWVTWVFQALERFVFSHYRACAAAGILFMVFMVAGAPFIRIDTQILGLFVDSSPVLRDMRFVEQNLAPIRSLELVVQMDDQSFKKPEAWKKLAELQSRLREMPDVAGLDSPLPLLEHLHFVLAKEGSDKEEIFTDRRVLSQVITVISLSAEGKNLLQRYVDSRFSRVHISVRIKNSAAASMGEIIRQLEVTASDVMQDQAKITVTGEQAVFAAQASEVVDSQVLSVVLAIIGVTILIMIQLRSVLLGFISLIPNIPPVAVIFGMMGWLGIPLDNVTVFAAAIAIGLAVDDTIHYLTQLKREMSRSKTAVTVEQCMADSYQKTARAMISTSATLFFGFLMLALTPTKPAIYFGFLGAAAILVALLGDLVFLQSIILSFSSIRKILNREVLLKKGTF